MINKKEIMTMTLKVVSVWVVLLVVVAVFLAVITGVVHGLIAGIGAIVDGKPWLALLHFLELVTANTVVVVALNWREIKSWEW